MSGLPNAVFARLLAVIADTDGVKIPLSNNRGHVLVDAEDAAWANESAWHIVTATDGLRAYAATGSTAQGNCQSMHRALLNAPAGKVVDHINGDGLDNRRCNLRVCTHTQNMRNRRALAPSASPYKGVARDGGSWRAQIRVNRKRIHLGMFASQKAAARAYDAAAERYFGEFAATNRDLGLLA